MGIFSAFQKNEKELNYIKIKKAESDGAACIAMLCEYYGYASPNEVLQNFSTNSGKVSMEDIMMALSKYSKSFAAYHCDIEDLESLACPAILYWKYSQFVVLEKVERKNGNLTYLIHDPLTKKGWVSHIDTTINFSGAILVRDGD